MLSKGYHMKKIDIKSDDQAIEFLEALIAENRVFHLDDHPKDIAWSTPIDPETLDAIISNWEALWENRFPWDLFDSRPELWARWMGESRPERVDNPQALGSMHFVDKG
jgi:hypothetical protein